MPCALEKKQATLLWDIALWDAYFIDVSFTDIIFYNGNIFVSLTKEVIRVLFYPIGLTGNKRNDFQNKLQINQTPELFSQEKYTLKTFFLIIIP